jgi:hypothetical protein
VATKKKKKKKVFKYIGSQHTSLTAPRRKKKKKAILTPLAMKRQLLKLKRNLESCNRELDRYMEHHEEPID